MTRCNKKICRDMVISCSYNRKTPSEKQFCPCNNYTFPISDEQADNNYKDMLGLCTGRFNALIERCLCWQRKRLYLYYGYNRCVDYVPHEDKQMLWDKLQLLIELK